MRRLGLLGLLPLLACGGTAGTGELPEDPAPQVRAMPASVVFGRVPVGLVAAQAVRIENDGNGASAPLGLVGVGAPRCPVVPEGARFCLELPEAPVPAGGAVGGRVLYFPGAVSPPETQAWRVGCGEACEVQLTARGSAVAVPATAPTGLDFGRARPGCRAEREVTLTSMVDVPLTVTEVRLVVATPEVYGLTVAEPLPLTLPGGATLTVGVSFTAPDGDVPGDLRFRLTAPGLEVADDYAYDVAVELIGRGDPAEPGC